jgi:drug/metabolite transporter (DMT)-like permease
MTAALTSSFSYVMLRRMGSSESPEAVVLHFSLVASAVLALVAAPHASVPDGRGALLMIGAGMGAGLGQIALTRAYALERAARVGGLSYLNVVLSTALGAIVLGEWPPARAVSGMALVVAGGLVVTLVGLREARSRSSESA